MFARRLFYLSGFDPRGARFYHDLHREQIARRAERIGQPITVSGRSRGEGKSFEWTVESAAEGTNTRVTFLRWDDIVGRAWVKGHLNLFIQTLRTYARNALLLKWWTGWKLGKGPMIAMSYPPLFVAGLPLLIGLPIVLLLMLVLPWWAAVAAAAVPAVWLTRILIVKMRACWLVRLFIYTDAIAAGGMPGDLAERLDAFAAQISEALDEGLDEVLLVAHSNGSILAVPIMLRLLELRGGKLPENFTLVTYGHCIPMLTGRRDAHWFHAMLYAISRHEFAWVDIGSPPDGAAFSLIDPLLPEATHGAIRLTLLSPRFHCFYDPENYRLDYASKYDAHFDYLRCGDRVSPLDMPSLSCAARPISAAIAEFRTIP